MKGEGDLPSSKSLEEWIRVYEKKSDSEFVLSKGEEIVYRPDKGFFSYLYVPDRDALEIPKMCGDGRYWAKEIRRVCKEMGIGRALFFTKRNPEAWTRRYGGKVYGYFLEITVDDAKIV